MGFFRYSNTFLIIEFNIHEQIEEKKYFLEWGSNSRTYLRAEMQKYFRSFLVQMKPLKSPFEINWPLPRRHAPIYAKQAGVQHYVLLLYSSGEWPQGFYLSAAASTRLGTLHTKEDTVLVFLNYQSHFVIN